MNIWHESAINNGFNIAFFLLETCCIHVPSKVTLQDKKLILPCKISDAIEQLRQIHLLRRLLARSALHHPVRIDRREKSCKKGETNGVLCSRGPYERASDKGIKLRPRQTAWQVRHEDHQHAEKETLTSSTGKPVAETTFVQIDVKSTSKQMRKISLSSAGQPAPKAEPKHIFGKFAVKVIKKHKKTDLTSRKVKPLADTRTGTPKWIAELKEYPRSSQTRK